MNPPDHVSASPSASWRSTKSTDSLPPIAQPPPSMPLRPPTPHRPAPPSTPLLPPFSLPPPSPSDPPEVYLPWTRLVHHPAAPNLIYRVPSHLLPVPPPPGSSAHRSRHQLQSPPPLPPELDLTSSHFNPSLALATPTSDLPPGFFQGHTSFPIFDNVAQFTALMWSAGTCASESNKPPPTTTHHGRLALDLGSLTAATLGSPTPTDLHPLWHAWLARLETVHASYHWDRMHRAIARTLADQADLAVVEREARKARVLKAREAALELRKLLLVWQLAETDDPSVVDHPRHPRWVGVNLRAWEEGGVEMPRGVDVLGGGSTRERGAEVEHVQGGVSVGGSQGGRGAVDRGGGSKRSNGSAGSRGLKWSHRKRIKDVRQQ